MGHVIYCVWDEDLILGKWKSGPSQELFIRVWIFLGTLGFDLGAVGFAEGRYVSSQGDTEEVVGL